MRIGGATRSMEAEDLSATVVEVLAPEHTGLTMSKQPTVYWYVSQPSTGRVEVALTDEEELKTVYHAALAGTIPAGIHAFSLAEHNLQLEADREYRWSVAVVQNREQRSSDLVASATLRHVPPSPSLLDKLSGNSESPSYYTLAEEGIWYDAVDELSKAIADSPKSRDLRELRAELLNQVNLPSVAAFERR